MNNTTSFPPVISQIDMNLSDICNLTCKFCYTRGGHGKTYNREHIDKTFNWMFTQFENASPRQKEQGLRVTIYGGEPLVEWVHLKEIIPAMKQEAIRRGTRIGFSIVTNMTLLDEEKLDWLMANNVGIHPSIDGCAPAQDACRIFKDGKGSSTIVYENARRLLSRTKGRSCRMTVTPETAKYMYASVVFLAKDIGFETVNAVMAGGIDWSDADITVIEEQVKVLTDWWMDEMRQGNHYSLYHLRNMFMGIWSAQRRRGLCSAGVSHAVVDTMGNIFPCHRFANFQSKPEYLMGTLDTGITNRTLFDALRTYDLALANKERCQNCIAVMGCHAFCIHEMMVAGNGMFEPLPHYCKIWPIYMKQSMRAHAIMTAEKNQLYNKIYNPQMQADNRNRSQQNQQQRQQCPQHQQVHMPPNGVPVLQKACNCNGACAAHKPIICAKPILGKP